MGIGEIQQAWEEVQTFLTSLGYKKAAKACKTAQELLSSGIPEGFDTVSSAFGDLFASKAPESQKYVFQQMGKALFSLVFLMSCALAEHEG